jgi:hypothetical protein
VVRVEVCVEGSIVVFVPVGVVLTLPLYSNILYVWFDIGRDILLTWVYKPPDFGNSGLASDEVKPCRPVFLLEQLDLGRFIIRRHLDDLWHLVMMGGW